MGENADVGEPTATGRAFKLIGDGPDLKEAGATSRFKRFFHRLLFRVLRPYERHQRAVAMALLQTSRETTQGAKTNADLLTDRVERLERKVGWIGGELDARPFTSDPSSIRVVDEQGREAIGYRNAPLNDRKELYFGFEETFRGSEQMIRERQRIYVGFLSGHDPILDIGCGRGEMLDLLVEDGDHDALGIDLDAAMVERCRAKGHKVELGDAIDFLAAQGEGSVGAVFSAQFIEHISETDLLRLFELSHKALMPGGVLIAETVNPHCPRALKTFWVDLTHHKPIFPETAVVLCRGLGFAEATIVFPGGTGSLEEDLRLQGEYAIVARKAVDSPPG